MIKYRIVYEYGLYYPQQRMWFHWISVNEPAFGHHTKEDALKDIESHNKMFGKDSGKKDIVWTGEME